ncbi:VOC family protein [Curtobacterium ammoniigenes]|uniref:VOC family protein n=1 Tax=Curtobacterium ammoniigenes TaxID=395387 RepID=UPI000833CFE7|nr:VOC family protein [Curtobacterium ammoniigenes]
MNTDADAVPRLVATVLDSPDPIVLARFYGALLGWTVFEDDTTWARVRPDVGPGLSMQLEPNYRRPVWPTEDDAPGMMLHLDFVVEDLPSAVARAEALGARQATWQPNDDVRVLIDPDGHPFCLFLPTA